MGNFEPAALKPVSPLLDAETERLTRAWMRHDQAALRDYLVADVEDPRLNVPSVLSRHFLVTAVCGGRFQELMGQEVRFAAAMNWLLALRKKLTCDEEWHAVQHALQKRAEDAEGIEIPGWFSRLFAALPVPANGLTVPNYIAEFLAAARGGGSPPPLPGPCLDTFLSLWRQALAGEAAPSPAPSVLEPACGSANDYRALHACGLARLVDYSGFDLCEKNVRNARALFPEARFDTGNVFRIAAADKSFDYLFAHDLFEHLSPAGLASAIQEVSRVTRRGLCLGFFNLDEIPEPIVRPVDDYHWNTLSVERLREAFAAHGFTGQVVHIGGFLRWATGCDHTHNPHAYTFLLRG